MSSGFSYLRASCCGRSRRRGLRRAYGAGHGGRVPQYRCGPLSAAADCAAAKNIIYMGMEKKRLPKTCPACGSTSGSSDLLNKIYYNIDNIYYCVNIIKQYVCLFMGFV